MKICPNCGAENDDNVLRCILCDCEFDESNIGEPVTVIPNSSNSGKDEPQNKAMQSDSTCISGLEGAAPDNHNNIHLLYVLVGVIAVLLVGVGILGGILLMKNKNEDGSNDSSTNAAATTTSDSTSTPTTGLETQGNTGTTLNTTAEVTSIPFTETIIPVTAADIVTQSKATVSISVEPQSINGNGTSLLMTVDGNYSYFTYEIYADCEGQNNTLRKSGTSFDRTFLYEDGSTVGNWVFYVTPYNSDGIAGERTSLKYNGPMSLPPSNLSYLFLVYI